MAQNFERNQERAEVTIKFGKGLVGEPFTSKKGKELVEIKIPNPQEGDHRPWESFVIPANFVHDNQYGKGWWRKLPEDGTTALTRNVVQGKDAEGKNIWGKETREVSNKELKGLLESYKEKNRSSALGELSSRKAEAAKESPVRAARDHDELPFR